MATCTTLVYMVPFAKGLFFPTKSATGSKTNFRFQALKFLAYVANGNKHSSEDQLLFCTSLLS